MAWFNINIYLLLEDHLSYTPCPYHHPPSTVHITPRPLPPLYRSLLSSICTITLSKSIPQPCHLPLYAPFIHPCPSRTLPLSISLRPCHIICFHCLNSGPFFLFLSCLSFLTLPFLAPCFTCYPLLSARICVPSLIRCVCFLSVASRSA